MPPAYVCVALGEDFRKLSKLQALREEQVIIDVFHVVYRPNCLLRYFPLH
jgi:hypothetical protein